MAVGPVVRTTQHLVFVATPSIRGRACLLEDAERVDQVCMATAKLGTVIRVGTSLRSLYGGDEVIGRAAFGEQVAMAQAPIATVR